MVRTVLVIVLGLLAASVMAARPIIIDVPPLRMQGITDEDLEREQQEKEEAERARRRAEAIAARTRKQRIGRQVIIKVPTLIMRGTAPASGKRSHR